MLTIVISCYVVMLSCCVVENEIEERKAFLAKMYQLGKGKDYHMMIETQISQVAYQC